MSSFKSIKPLLPLLAIVVVAVIAALVGYARPIEHYVDVPAIKTKPKASPPSTSTTSK